MPAKRRTKEYDNRPIGLFDSGLGGLTVVRAVREALPDEDVIYLGDTARVPYGNRSPETVELFARQDLAFLEKFGYFCNHESDTGIAGAAGGRGGTVRRGGEDDGGL